MKLYYQSKELMYMQSVGLVFLCAVVLVSNTFSAKRALSSTKYLETETRMLRDGV